jgi:Ca2+-binding RTX toxin-like protein
MPVLRGTSWGTTPSILGDAGGVVTWSIAAGGLGISQFGNNITTSVYGSSFLNIDFEAEISQALAQWSNAGNIEFMQIEDGGGAAGSNPVADIRIFFGSIPSSTIGFGFYPTDPSSAIAGDVLLDTALDLGRFPALLVHEFGHALGLEHLPNGSTTVMTPTVFLSTLQADDILGITQIYGVQDNAPTSYTMPSHQIDMNILESPYQLSVTGNGAGNRIDGTSASETVFGAGGDDVLIGGAGNDVIFGGADNDTAGFSGSLTEYSLSLDANGVLVIVHNGNDGTDTLAGVEFAQFNDQLLNLSTVSIDPLSGDDDFIGGADDDTLDGGRGNDRLVGDAGNDTLYGGDGSDTLNGGEGDDFIFGGGSTADLRDIVFAGAGNDSVNGGYGNDEIFGQDGNDTIAGGFGSDTLNGQNGNDVLTGSALSDLVSGNAGDDFVNGGFGHDRINGGTGADRFFHLGILDHGSDFIQDYNAAEGDLLLFGIAGATRSQFQINSNHATAPDGERAGDDNVEEAFVIYRPTGQIMWALIDGASQSSINLRLGSDVFDLLA